MNDTLDYFAESQIENLVIENLLKTQENRNIAKSTQRIENSILFDDSLFLQDYNSQDFFTAEQNDKNSPKNENDSVSQSEGSLSQIVLSDNSLLLSSDFETAIENKLSELQEKESIHGDSQEVISYSQNSESEVFKDLDSSKCNECPSNLNNEEIKENEQESELEKVLSEVPETPEEMFDEVENDNTQNLVESEPTDNHNLSSWGLPGTVLKNYAKRKITTMFDWQLECLSKDGIFDNNRNLVYSAPTSAGKTLVAEILAMKCLFERKKKVLFILPFISVVREKVYYFQDLLGSSGKRVEGFMGSYNPPGGFQSVHMAVGTIEKCNSLVNRLMEENKLEDVGLVIIDEMHLIGDPYRGYLLELLLTKLKYIMTKNTNVQIQLVGMSATLPNLDSLSNWLNAELYTTTFRPIPLYEMVYVNKEIYNNEFKLLRRLSTYPELAADTDDILQLCLEIIEVSSSVLIFCPTKNWCENLAQQVAMAFWRIGRSDSGLSKILHQNLSVEKITEVLEQLKYCPSGLDRVLKNTVAFGVAFHHAGLTMEERDIIEGGFRNGGIKLLIATSTLSSGVNLPARRVIIRSPVFNGRPIDILTYRQMIGRAGRMGIDTEGQSILICQKKDYETAKYLTQSSLKPVRSCLEDVGKFKRAILEIIASGVASSPEDLKIFAESTLISTQKVDEPDKVDPVMQVVEFLKNFNFIRLQKVEDGTNKYFPTALGRACLSSALPPGEGLELFTELEKARQCLVLETELHLIYLVTPYSSCYQWPRIDWMLYLELWEKLPFSMKKVGELVGVRESFIINATRRSVQDSPKLMIHKRFFIALALQDLVNEKPLEEVAAKFVCNRGLLQSLQQSASTFAGMVTSFSRQLGWSSIEILISQFQDRLQFGISRDLLDLMRLPTMNSKQARAFFTAGIETLIQLANSDVNTIENVLHKVMPFENAQGREGESEHDFKQRNKLRTVWITGKQGLTEGEAAEIILTDARRYLEHEMGVKDIKWGEEGTEEDSDTSIEFSENKENSPNNINSSLSNSVEPLEIVDDLKTTTKKGTKGVMSASRTNSQRENSKVKSDKFQIQNFIAKDKQKNNEIITESKTKKILSPKKQIHENNKKIIVDEVSSKYGENMASISSNVHYQKQTCSLDSGISLSLIVKDKTKTSGMSSPNTKMVVKSKSQMHEKKISKGMNSEKETDSLDSGISLPTQLPKSDESSLNSYSDNDLFEESLEEAIDKVCSLSVDSRKRINESNAVSQSKRVKIDENRECFSFDYNDKRNEVNQIDLSKFFIIDVCKYSELYESFCVELIKQRNISISLACRHLESNKPKIGLNSRSDKENYKYSFENRKVDGVAITWDGKHVFYLFMEDNGCEDKYNLLQKCLQNKQNCIQFFDSKECIVMFSRALGLEIYTKVEDPKVLNWLLEPDAKEKDFHTMISKYCPEAKGLSTLVDTCRGHTGLGMNVDNAIEPRMRASIEAVVTWNLIGVMKDMVDRHSVNLLRTFELEMEVMLITAKMEISGIGIDFSALESLMSSIKSESKCIETKIFSLAGRKFSLTSSREIAKAIGLRTTKKISTNKQVLEESKHPISDLIILWRKLSCTLSKMLQPLSGSIKNNNRVYGRYINHTSTGRLSMHEPNIQNLAKDFEFVHPLNHETVSISCRRIFVPKKDCIFISADYCQLELRMLAHLSGDELLCSILREDGDIFKRITAEWNRISEEEVTDGLRNQTKQICYGIIYGIGSKALAQQLKIEPDEAANFMEKFKNTYPALKIFIQNVIDSCRENGYVETISGRRRNLPLISDENPAIRSHAERQAVNTTIQGSAADLVKTAMKNVEDALNDNFDLCEKPTLVLHLHDELLFEVKKKHISKTANLLKEYMESLTFTVPFPVKLKVGESWGTLKEQCDIY